MHVRNMQQEDIARVYAVEQRAQISPWSLKTIENCLHSDYQCLLLEDEGVLVGYCFFTFVLDECHILNIVVAQEFQGKGYSHALMQAIISAQAHSEMPIKRIFLEVRASNIKAQSLYQKWGFDVLSMRKDYYKKGEGKEDALIYVRK